MQINIKLDENFSKQFEQLRADYGPELARLNGFAEEQLNYTDFIDNFIDKDTVADATIDANANVGTKDVCSLLSEMNKPHSKLLAFNKIYHDMAKLWGEDAARRWLVYEWDGHYYLHDASTASVKPYCFRGDTEILTKDGIKRLDELVDKPIKVFGKNHGWENATVKHFGKDTLRKLTLTRHEQTKEIYVTGNHRWFVKGSERTREVCTDDLIPGMKIPFNVGNVWAKVQPSPFGVAHGFFTGDGDKSQMRANFCGDKVALLPYYMPATINGSEREYTVSGAPQYFRELPSLTESPSYLYGWLAGYFAADGCVDTNGRCTLASCDHRNLEFARNVLCVLGMPVNQIRQQERVSNLTGEPGIIYTITLSSECLREDFFIRPLHKERWRPHIRNARCWVVASVEDTGVEDDVYCAVVPGSESFTLEGNVLTHNCFAYDIKPLVEKGLYFVGNFNAQPPKHLVTFTDFVGEFVSYTSNRSSGACGLPSFLVYSFYFWKKDCESNYLGMKTPEDFERYRDQEFQRIIYKLNQPYLRVNQSAFTNFSIFDQSYYTELFGGLTFPDGTFAIDYLDDFIEYQKAFMRVVGKIREQNMVTFPVLTYSLLYRDGKFVNEDFAKWCCERNMYWADSNFFVSSDVTSLSNCCRLVSDIKSLGGLYFNSVGGTALEVGSVKVNTINLARIAYESSKEDYMERLKELTTLCCMTLDTQRHIIQRDIEKGLLPNYTHELLHLSSQYSTIGVIGIYEALEHYGLTAKDEFGNTYYTDEAIAFAQELFKVIHETKDAFLKHNARDYQINIEQIPAERAASVLMEKDKLFFPDEAYELPLYGNQFIPLGIKCTIQEKIRLSALLDRACNGGSIAHINIDAPFASFESAWDALNYVARSGVVYFAFCTRISACESNHGFYGDTCPICGKPKVTTYQRIVG